MADIGQVDTGERHRNRRRQRIGIGLLVEVRLCDLIDHRRVIGALDRDHELLGRDPAVLVVDADRIGQL